MLVYFNPYAVLYFALEEKDLDFFRRVTEVIFYLWQKNQIFTVAVEEQNGT